MVRFSLLALSILGSLPLSLSSAIPQGVDILPRAASSSRTSSHASSSSHGSSSSRGVSSSAQLSSATPASTRSHPSSLPHSSFTGSASTTGALTATSVGKGISSGSIAPAATTYRSDGKLHNAEAAPFSPAGGVGTNGTIPVYNVRSDFDYQSLVCFLCVQISFELVF